MRPLVSKAVFLQGMAAVYNQLRDTTADTMIFLFEGRTADDVNVGFIMGAKITLNPVELQKLSEERTKKLQEKPPC